MAQTVVIDNKTINTILSTLRDIKKEVVRLSEKLKEAPPYGSEEWWEWSDKRALNSIKGGRGTTITSKKELNNFFKSL